MTVDATMRLSAVHAPDWRTGNPYQELLSRALDRAGVDIAFSNYPPGLFPLRRIVAAHPSASVLHLHWINALLAPIMRARGPLSRQVKRAALAAEIRWVRTKGVRVVWTVHNLLAHESGDPSAELRARRIVARSVNYLIVSSESARRTIQQAFRLDLGHKSAVIPHGNYDGCYPILPARSERLAARWGLRPEHTVVLFFGHIRRYKGVERLVDALRSSLDPNLRVLLAGRPFERELEAMLQAAAAAEPRLLLALEFIPDDEVAAYFSLADIVALPFSRTLTSGSAVLALTFSKPLLLPSEARVLDLADSRGALYFESADELAAHLQTLDKAALAEMGASNRRVADTLGWDRIAEATVAVYRGTPVPIFPGLSRSA